MRKVVIFIVMVLLLVLDNSFCPFFAIKGVAPSLLFVFTIAFSIIHEKNEAVVIGVVSGMLQDIYFTNGFGINALVNIFCCLIASYIGESIWKEKKLIPTATMFGVSILKYYVVLLILYFIGVEINIVRGIFIALYNSIIMFFAYKTIFKKLNIERNETSWRFKWLLIHPKRKRIFRDIIY